MENAIVGGRAHPESGEARKGDPIADAPGAGPSDVRPGITARHPVGSTHTEKTNCTQETLQSPRLNDAFKKRNGRGSGAARCDKAAHRTRFSSTPAALTVPRDEQHKQTGIMGVVGEVGMG